MRERLLVLVIGFKRPLHLAACLNSLSRNKGFESYQVRICLDGPASARDHKCCSEVMGIAEGFARNHTNTTVIQEDQNQGLGDFILQSIDKVFEDFEEVIVLEDDLITSPYFLEFCSWGLNEYRQDSLVSSISGFSLPIKGLHDNYFLRGADCWGWATWKDRWQGFERDSVKLMNEIKRRRLQRVFDLDYSYQYTHMLERQCLGKTNSWAIRWHAYNFLKGRMILYPQNSLVVNVGNDGSGTNMGVTDAYVTSLNASIPPMNKIVVQENIFARKALISYYRSVFPPSLKSRALNIIRRLVKTDSYSFSNSDLSRI